MHKVTNTKLHNGTIKSGIAKGEPAKILDYSTDNGKTWINHGIYCRNFTKRAYTLDKSLVGSQIMNSRADVIFPAECDERRY